MNGINILIFFYNLFAEPAKWSHVIPQLSAMESL